MEEGRALPVGWAVSPLLEAGDLIRGVTYSKKDASDLPFENSIPVLRANNIQNGSLWLEGLVHVPFDLVSEEQRIKAGDIVIATSSGSVSVVGKAAQAKSDLGAGFGAFCGLVRPSSNLCARYLGHFFGTDYYRNSVSSMARGVNINNLKKSHFEELRLPLAPLNEQRRIAAKLDTTLAAVDACRQRLDGVEALLKRFRQAVLAAATSGELTREWREGKEIAFDRLAIKDLCLNERYSLCIGPFGSNLKVSDYEEQGVPLVFVREIRAREFGGPSTKYVTPEKADELIAHQVRPGDLLMTKMGAPPGDTAIYPEDLPFAIMTSDVVCIRPDPRKIDKTFLSYLLESPGGRDLIQGITAGVAQQKISLERLKTVFLKVPSLPEQQEIVRRAQRLFSLADQLEAKLTAARQVVERLTLALLAKAFRGELVPQDPSDEPASVLLERIRAARQAEAAAGKPSRRGRRKAADHPEQAPRPAAPAPPDLLAQLLQECGALSERALLAASELDPAGFRAQLALEQGMGAIRETAQDGQVLLEAVG